MAKYKQHLTEFLESEIGELAHWDYKIENEEIQDKEAYEVEFFTDELHTKTLSFVLSDLGDEDVKIEVDIHDGNYYEIDTNSYNVKWFWIALLTRI